jgi:hypothetical protein
LYFSSSYTFILRLLFSHVLHLLFFSIFLISFFFSMTHIMVSNLDKIQTESSSRKSS